MSEVTPAQKRDWLRQNGYDVATRGRLSAEHEQAYAEQRPSDANGPVVQGVEANPHVA
jgi:hypothetical protein